MDAATAAIEADGLDVIVSGFSVGGEGQEPPGQRDDQGALDASSIRFDGIDRTITTAYISCRGADGDGEVTLEEGRTSIGYRFRCSRDGTTDRISDDLDAGTGRFVMRVTRSPAGTVWAIVVGGPPGPDASPSAAPPTPSASVLSRGWPQLHAARRSGRASVATLA
ncbi:hypothetical protein [Schumannella soli]|uniref:Uncharacterized protein n=1 Tax=Schumannella soli TaxID=2590779 RepID=A0A506XN43_9MICO|nr:hypothetical protein [Schumannella soli]TPW74064.1 hypothetical protein FJ657_15575 [Schumannella soli]